LRSKAYLAFCALTCVLITACGLPGEQQDAIHIGAIYPLSGPQGSGGREELDGVRAALAVARNRGLPFASRISLDVRDLQTTDQVAPAIDSFAARGVGVVVGSYGSALSEAAADEADKRHVVFWETGAVADPVTAQRSYVFRTVATGSSLGRMAVEFTAKVLAPANGGPAPRAVILAVDDLYGRSVSDQEALRAGELGLTVAAVIRYNPHAYDPKVIAEQVAAANPDYLLDVSYIDDGAAIWRQLIERGVKLRGAVGTSSAFCMPAFGQMLGAQAVGVFAADKPDDAINRAVMTTGAEALLDDAKRAYRSIHGSSEMSIPALAGFVGGWALFHDTLSLVSGSISADSVRSAAYRVDVPAGGEINGGGVRFSAAGNPDAGQNLRAVAVVGQWQAVQVMKIVYPGGFATASPIIPEAGRWP
jgi:branched-chain amino acid transport system substrate-binding protein